METAFWLLAEFEPRLIKLHANVIEQAKSSVAPYFEREVEESEQSYSEDVALDSLVGTLWDKTKPQVTQLVGDFADNNIPWKHAHYDYIYHYLERLTRKHATIEAHELGYFQ